MNNQGPYGKKKSPPKYEPKLTPFSELCHFADEYGFVIELEKPFSKLDNMFLRLLRKRDNMEICQIMLKNIDSINEYSSKLLNALSKKVETH